MANKKYSRVEVIDHSGKEPKGRVLVKYEENLNVELQEQDNGKTLKIFINNERH